MMVWRLTFYTKAMLCLHVHHGSCNVRLIHHCPMVNKVHTGLKSDGVCLDSACSNAAAPSVLL